MDALGVKMGSIGSRGVDDKEDAALVEQSLDTLHMLLSKVDS